MDEAERRDLRTVRALAAETLARVRAPARRRQREDDAAFAALLTRKVEQSFEIEMLEAAE